MLLLSYLFSIAENSTVYYFNNFLINLQHTIYNTLHTTLLPIHKKRNKYITETIDTMHVILILTPTFAEFNNKL